MTTKRERLAIAKIKKEKKLESWQKAELAKIRGILTSTKKTK